MTYSAPPPDAPSSEGAPVSPTSDVEQHAGIAASGVPSQPQGVTTTISGPPATIGRARGARVRQRTGAWPAGGTPRVDPNSLESVADDVAYWIETTAQDVARAMMDGMYAPFSARISQGDTARYYGETLFTPEGQLDPTQWWAEYARLGPDGLARAIDGAAQWRRARGLRVALPVSQFQPTGVGPGPSGTVSLTPASGTPPEAPGPEAFVPPPGGPHA